MVPKRRPALRGYLLAIIFFIALPVGCATTEDAPYDFERGNAIQFINYLKTHVNEHGEGMYTIQQPIKNWVQVDDIPALIELLKSNSPAAAVHLSASSSLRFKSTVRDEAAFLIEGYRANRYPPSLRSDEVSPEEVAELIDWWEKTCCEKHNTGTPP